MLGKIVHALRAVREQGKIVLVLLSCALLGIVITYVLYDYTRVLLKERLQERLVAIVSTAATQFNPEDILAVRGEADMDKPAYERLVKILMALQNSNTDIQYAYLMRKTDDPNTLEFVADAQGLIPPEQWDFDEDGIVGEEDEAVPLPGEPFDTSPYPELRDEAFVYPVAAKDLEEDKWSVQLSAYAPIYYQPSESVAIVGIDVVVNDFKKKTEETLLPFMLFIFALILILTLLTIILMRLYNERVEVMREIDRQKDELISIVSHQLNTPVSAVKWNIEMFLDGDLGKMSEEQTKQLNLMQSELTNLADLVSMLLDVSRIQLGRMKVSRADLDLAAFFAEELAVIEPKAKEKKVKFTAHIPAKLPVGYLDKRLVRMTLENLLTNAVKYTPEGGQASLTVKLHGDKLSYEVKDTGCGIPKAEQARMFEKLFRASNVVNAQEGNGLGMFVAKGAVEAQGGSIRFESTEGKGSTFFVEVPLGKKPVS